MINATAGLQLESDTQNSWLFQLHDTQNHDPFCWPTTTVIVILIQTRGTPYTQNWVLDITLKKLPSPFNNVFFQEDTTKIQDFIMTYSAPASNFRTFRVLRIKN